MPEDAQGELKVQGPDSLAVSKHELAALREREQRVEKTKR